MTGNAAEGTAFGKLERADKLDAAEIDARAQTLLAALTLDEKIGLMSGDLPFWQGLAQMAAPGGYSSRVWIAGEVARLGIPGIRFSDGPRGIVMDGATTFPVSMARGATFDPELEERVGDAIGAELRALRGNLFAGVCINLLRHPAWGRAQETYGEDPRHVGAMGAALAKGVQRHVMACVKHYALNSMENARQTVDVSVDQRALHEVYLPHFKRVIESGVASVMSAYNTVNGEQAGQNTTLLTGILKTEWQFAGFIMTDFILGMRDAKKAALAGQDLEMPFSNLFQRHLKGLVERGEVPLARIDDAALRLLRQQVRFGQGRDPKRYKPALVGCDAHRAVAREAAEKSIVLLKNDGPLLPLAAKTKLAVIGPLADVANTGDGGSSNTRPRHVVTPLEGLRAALGEARVTFDSGNDLARAARVAGEAEVALLVVGYTHADEGEYIPPDQLAPYADLFPKPGPAEAPFAEKVLHGLSGEEGGFSPGGDRLRLELRPSDEALIKTCVAANPRTIVAIMAGSAVVTEAWRELVPAILMLWYPGQEGGHALAGVLLGKINPSGRLPCSFAKSASDLPFFDRDANAIAYDLWHGYRKLDRDGNAAAFPFGFGLSYTSFVYANLRLARVELRAKDALEATIEVTNTGKRAGDEVVQLYVSALGSKVERAVKELKAFARISLAPGERRTVTLAAPIADLAWRDAERGWVIEAIEYEALAARHAGDPSPLRARFRVS